jgi:hypothetical protein
MKVIKTPRASKSEPAPPHREERMKTEFIWTVGESLRELVKALAGDKHDEKLEHLCECCEIPETACPPRCVGTIKWSFGRGAAPKASIVVRNVGKVARPFAFSATALAGSEPGSSLLEVQPASATLAPGESTVLSVALKDSLALTACQEYRAEVLVNGSWEQCVRVLLHVERDAFDATSLEQSNSLKDKTFHAPAIKSGLDWKIDRGVTPEGTITVHNAGTSSQSFHFDSNAVVGPGGASANVALSPDSLLLAAGQTGTVRVKLEGSSSLSPGQVYTSDVRVRGYYEQRIGLRCAIEPDASGHAEVEQGEAPTRRRAHRWHDHFQCTESCS